MAAAFGGFVLFIWGMFSWMMLPFHHSHIRKFTDESSVAAVIKKNAPSSGIYELPNTFAYTEGTTREEMAEGLEMMEEGPYMFASVRVNGVGKMSAWPFAASLIVHMIGAFIAIWLLLQTKGLSSKKQVGFITLFGFGVGILGLLPDWIWWGFPVGFIAVNSVDLVIGWFLAGLCIVHVLRK
jgi:hypothetical protein